MASNTAEILYILLLVIEKAEKYFKENKKPNTPATFEVLCKCYSYGG